MGAFPCNFKHFQTVLVCRCDTPPIACTALIAFGDEFARGPSKSVHGTPLLLDTAALSVFEADARGYNSDTVNTLSYYGFQKRGTKSEQSPGTERPNRSNKRTKRNPKRSQTHNCPKMQTTGRAPHKIAGVRGRTVPSPERNGAVQINLRRSNC